VLRRPADPWQEWLFIHAGELLPDGMPRFRIVLVLVARQNGKTECPVILSTYWQFVEEVPLILGTSTKLDYARESWLKAVNLVMKVPDFDDQRPKVWTRNTNGEQESWTFEGSRYKIAANNEEGGRSLTVHRLVLDELRQHHDYSAYSAAEEATSAVWDAQIWALSNAGDEKSVVLNDLRAAALEYIETGEGDYRLGLFEWSAEEDADPLDPVAHAQANPNLGVRKDPDALMAKARRAVKLGGEALTAFKTESLCIRVKVLDPAIDPGAWLRCLDPGDLAAVRSRVACCVDVAPDAQHATLAAAAVLADGRVRVEVVEAWEGAGCTDRLRSALPALLARVRPRTLGWFPSGPAAALAADLADRRKAGRRGWPPAGVEVAEIRGEISAACMGFAEQVSAVRGEAGSAAGGIAHSGDPLLNAQVAVAERLKRGDAWTFVRRGTGHVDAVYAACGAVHLARTLPTSVGKPRLVVASGSG
jgi:hypothetical protein